MNVECRKKIAAARMAIGDNLNTVSGFPYFRAGINALIPVEDSTGTLDTMAVDKYGRMYFNADFVLGLSLHELSAVIVHEAQHILLNHHTRHPLGVDAMKWNIAGDLEINSCARLQAALPDGCLTGAQYNLPDGKLAEFYLSNIPWEDEEEPEGGNGGGDGDGDGGGDGDDQDGTGGGRCEHGTGAGTGDKPWELGAPEDPADALDSVDVKQLQHQVAKDIQESSQARGDMSADMFRKYVSVLERPKVKWQQALRMHVRRATTFISGQSDRTYRRVSILQSCVPNDVVLAGSESPVPAVSVVIDTSGSMTDRTITTAVSEAQGIVKACAGGMATMYAVDCEASAPQKIRHVRDLNLTGGGGTDMRVGIRAAVDDGANIVIVMTDNGTYWPTNKIKGVKVICCLVGDYIFSKASYPRPDWIPTIRVE